jgi:hypothetical protein
MIARVNLHDELAKGRYHHAFICTFNFQPDFFEDYCLESFDSLQANGNITILMDGREYDTLLDGPPARWPRKANVRYLLRPMRPHARFHPKLYLLTSTDRALLAVGSANLSRAGMTRNAELMGVFRYVRGKDEQDAPVFAAACEFVSTLVNRWPSPAVESNLGELLAEVPWAGAETLATPPRVRLIHDLDRPLLDQICEGISGSIDELLVVSPYFDPEPHLLNECIARLRPRSLAIHTQNALTTMTEAWVRHPALQKQGALRFCTWQDADHVQNLHAKAIALVYGDHVRVAYGSANFTRAGLRSTPLNGNVELAVVTDLPRRGLSLAELFDPGDSATSGPLRSAHQEPTPPPPPRTLRLMEASLEEQRMTCAVEGPSTARLTAVLAFRDGASARVPLSAAVTGWTATVAEEVESRCAMGSTVVRVELAADGTLVTSNAVLLVNLKDLDTGACSRRERRVREAQRSAEQFATALTDILNSGDQDALFSFLSYCDIRLVGGIRGMAPGRERPPLAQLQAQLRELGARNLREYADVHEAAVGFCERHLARLQRHALAPTLESVPACLHLSRAVAHVLFSQTERLVSGLEAGAVLDPDTWHQHRTRLDRYLTLYLELLRILHLEWLPELVEAYPGATLREVLSAADLDALAEFRTGFRSVRDRVERCRTGPVRIRTLVGRLVEPPVYDDNVIAPRAWTRWSDAVGTHGRAVEALAI